MQAEGRWLEQHSSQRSSSGDPRAVERGVADGQLACHSQSEPSSAARGPTRRAN